MPWKPSDAAGKTHLADTSRRKRMFADVADSVLAKTGDDGRAIREANAVVHRDHEKPKTPKKHWSGR